MTDRTSGKPRGKGRRKAEPAATKLDPSHPNYDAILLRRARLEAYRKRRKENAEAAASVSSARPGRKKRPPAD